ncbi:LysR substrate-binding domain-containing protein [Telmatospirillum sp.]|uniref:LysR substrate-binding domain-containing protein n=1 Tax=Telmatospirillum sp. TaxID=2079197 RepID=UPI00284C84C0|nr:LysR substrate-binding domain-containing protein [Telmatospirillum sp.]MDR3438302.1 LysR substrate-binding domain-containing protein [Telmatospirillum sp.]
MTYKHRERALDIRQLKYLIAVTEELNFGKAALRLHVAQSALSHQIQLLEEEIGIRLLDRNKRAPIHLTEAGKQFLAAARAALEHFNRTELVGRRLGRGELGKVKIGYVASATFSGLLPATAFAFRQQWPNVDIDIKEMESTRQTAALTAGEIDIGFFRPLPDYPIGIEAIVLLQEPVIIALRRDHPLIDRATPILAADLAGCNFIVPQSDDEAGFSRHVATIARQGGFTPHFSHHMRDFISVLSLVGVGIGIAAVPASLQCVQPADVVYRPIADCAISAELMAAFRRDEQSPAIVNFIKVIRQHVRTASHPDMA